MELNLNRGEFATARCEKCDKFIGNKPVCLVINSGKRSYYCEKYKCLNFDKIILGLGYKKSSKYDSSKFNELEYFTYFRKKISIKELDDNQDVFIEVYRPNFFYDENLFGNYSEYIISSSFCDLLNPYIINKITFELCDRNDIALFLKESEIKIIKTIQFLLKDKN
jgi:hypothetical protein